MDLDGGNQLRVTHSPANDVSPSWSPDGSLILFASDRDNNWEIYTVRPDGSDLTRLTAGPGANSSPSWAWGGTRILFISTRDAVNGELYLMNTDGSNVQRLTNDQDVKDSPVMSPDKQQIIFTVNAGGLQTIASFHLPAGPMRVLTAAEYNSVNPCLSPDGANILFASDRDGNLEIYSMTISGDRQTRITRSSDDEYGPVFVSTQGEILFSRRGGICLRSPDGGSERVLSARGDRAPHWVDSL